MRRHRRLLCAALACTFASYSHRAAAQSEDGFAITRLDISEHGSEWFSSDSLDFRGHGRWAAGLVLDWAHKPLVAYDANGDEIAVPIENQFFGHVGGNVLLWDRLRLGLNIPVLLFQNGEAFDTGDTEVDPKTGAAFGDVRLSAEARLFGKYRGPASLVGGVRVHLPTGNRAAFISDGSARFLPRLILAGDLAWFTYSVRTEVDFRFASDDFAGVETGHEWLFGATLGARLADGNLVVGPEIWGSTVISDGKDGFFRKEETPLEVILGAHYRLGNWMLGAGGGPGLTRGVGAPSVRGLLSLAYFPKYKEAPPPPAAAPKDSDGDGIVDPADACPTKRGIRSDDPKLHGCPEPDTDGDGFQDGVDACPTLPGIASDDPQTNGCPPPPDKDKDGILDVEDACPEEPGVTSEDPDKNGCPPPRDGDSDGIFDEADACPAQPGVESKDPKKHGCPKAVIENNQVKILERIEFDTGKATIRSESDGVLVAVLNILKDHPEITKLSIEGHTDNTGSKWLNMRLSKQRAESVKKWLIEGGIDPARLSFDGFGPVRPIDDNSTEEGRQNNRRVEFHIMQNRQNAQSNGGTAQ